MTILSWCMFAVAVAGVLLNVRRRRSGFALWIVSNAWWAAYNLRLGEWALAAQFAVFLALAVWGWCAWRKP